MIPQLPSNFEAFWGKDYTEPRKDPVYARLSMSQGLGRRMVPS